jgi:uncharacterized protein (DUF58 family)
MRHARWPIQLFRIASLVVPPALAWYVAVSATRPTELTKTVGLALGALWALVAGALATSGLRALARSKDGPSLLDRMDVLTASGSALGWTAAIAVMASVWIGWASLSIVGLLGMGTLALAVVWATVSVGGEDPFGRASVSRRFVPEVAPEGAAVIEELYLSNVRIPVGFRLFASGRVGPRWAMSRYVVEDGESGGEIRLESDVGPAIRGDHEAEPLEIWLQDVFGLCRSARVRARGGRLTVLPRLRTVVGAEPLLAERGVDLEPKASDRLPTEGALKLREYQPGDDARRIHWVRSLTARELFVRLPDEVPPDRPGVRLLLDTFLPGVEAYQCVAPAELLDALVAVWLGVGRALADGGARVTLVTAAPKEAGTVRVEQPLSQHTMSRALRLGAEVRWQDTLSLTGLATDEPTIIVSYRSQPDPTDGGEVRWILVPEPVWTCFADPPQRASAAVHSYPLGTPDNRWSRRRRERTQQQRALRDHRSFGRVCADTATRQGGSLVARSGRDERIRLEVVPPARPEVA